MTLIGSKLKKKSEAANDEHSMSLWEQITIYLGIVVGVFSALRPRK